MSTDDRETESRELARLRAEVARLNGELSGRDGELAACRAELEQTHVELAEAREQQAALGEIGEAVSSSLDLQEVLTTVVEHATRLAQADGGTIYELDEPSGGFMLRASYLMPEQLQTTVQLAPPLLGDDTLLSQALRDGVAVQ